MEDTIGFLFEKRNSVDGDTFHKSVFHSKIAFRQIGHCNDISSSASIQL